MTSPESLLESLCLCGHPADWHSHDGTGDCEHDADCLCKSFKLSIAVPPRRSWLPSDMKLADLLAAEFTLRKVMDEDEASSGVVALKEAGFVLIAPQTLAEAALVQEGLRDA